MAEDRLFKEIILVFRLCCTLHLPVAGRERRCVVWV